MKIENTNSQIFLAKQKFLSKGSYVKMQKLLSKMNEQTVCGVPNGDVFESKVLDKIQIAKNTIFIDSRWLLQKNISEEALSIGDSFVKTSDTNVKINNANGEIKILMKPWYKSAKQIGKMIERYINTGLNNFENSNIVEKQFSNVYGYVKDIKTI